MRFSDTFVDVVDLVTLLCQAYTCNGSVPSIYKACLVFIARTTMHYKSASNIYNVNAKVIIFLLLSSFLIE